MTDKNNYNEEVITEDDLIRAKKNKHSITNSAGMLDIWTKFKICCVEQGMTLRKGLNLAIRLFLKQHGKV